MNWKFGSVLPKISVYIKANWGAPFIAAFIALLLSTVVFLSTSLSYVAETLGDFAFYALVVGVTLQFLCYIKYRKSN